MAPSRTAGASASKDANGTTIDVPSPVSGKVRRWRARYVDNAGRERSVPSTGRSMPRWLAQVASLLPW